MESNKIVDGLKSIIENDEEESLINFINKYQLDIVNQNMNNIEKFIDLEDIHFFKYNLGLNINNKNFKMIYYIILYKNYISTSEYCKTPINIMKYIIGNILPIVNIEKTIIYNIVVFISGSFPYYILNSIFKKYDNLFKNPNLVLLDSIYWKDNIYAKCLSSALQNNNLSIIYNLSLIEKLKFWEICLLSYHHLDMLFQYYNHNSQKNLKKIIKNKKTKNNSIIISIRKSLVKNNQFSLLNLFYRTNGLGDMYQDLSVIEELLISRDLFNINKWLLINSSNSDSKFNLDDWINLFEITNNIHLFKNLYIDNIIEIYGLLIKYCKYKTIIFDCRLYSGISLIDVFASLKGGCRILKNIDVYVKNWDGENIINVNNLNGWNPILNSARYSDFITFLFLFERSNDLNKFTLSNTSRYYFTILNCSLMNSDERIYKFILEHLDSFSSEYIKILEDHLELGIENLFLSKNIPIRFKLKRLEYLAKYFDLKKNINCMISAFIVYFQENYICNKKRFYNVCYLIKKYDPKLEIIDEYTLLKICIDLYDKNKNKKYKNIFTNLYRRFNFNEKQILSIFKESILLLSWFHPINQEILNIIPDLKSLNKYNKCMIIDSVIKKNYYNRFKKLDEILFILGDQGFDFKSLIFNYKNEKIHIIKYLILIYKRNILNLFLRKYISLDLNDIHFIDNLNPYQFKIILPWIKIYRFLRIQIRRRNNNYFQINKKKMMCAKTDLLYRPILLEKENNFDSGLEYRKTIFDYQDYIEDDIFNNKKKALHLDIFNMQAISKSKNLCITEKADGINVKNLPNTIVPNLKIKLKYLRAEYIKHLNLYLVFDVCDLQCGIDIGTSMKVDQYIKMEWLRSLHTYTNRCPIREEFNQKNVYEEEENIKCFLEFERDVKKYEGPLWYPKKVWRINKNTNLFSLLKKNSSLWKMSIFPCDGCIIYDKNNNLIVKIKPLNFLTIDLKYDKLNWKTNEGVIIDNIEILKNEIYKIGVWRCYYDNKNGTWIPKEFRTDKKIANNYDLVKLIKIQQELSWNIFDEKMNKKMYYEEKKKMSDSNCHKFLNYQRSEFLKMIKKNIGNSILDIGCGYAKYLSEIEYNFWLGLDIDIDCLNSVMKNDLNKMKRQILYFDIGNKWNLESQDRRLLCQNYNNFYEKRFDLIILNFSFQYCLEKNSYNYIAGELYNRCENDGKVIINYMDGDKLDENVKIPNIQSCKNHNYLKFHWVHSKWHKELKMSGKKLKKSMIDSGFRIIEDLYNISEDLSIEFKNIQKLYNYVTFLKN